jgi:hypothetical protein
MAAAYTNIVKKRELARAEIQTGLVDGIRQVITHERKNTVAFRASLSLTQSR